MEEKLILLQYSIAKYDSEIVLKEKLNQVLSPKEIERGIDTLIGTRAAEPEEIENARNAGLRIVNPLDIAELGVKRVAQLINARTARSKIYISVDLDCVDPASAPGVSVPSPAGVAANDLIYLLNKVISYGNVVGIDIVELTPDYDINGMTAMLAARILSECIASV